MSDPTIASGEIAERLRRYQGDFNRGDWEAAASAYAPPVLLISPDGSTASLSDQGSVEAWFKVLIERLHGQGWHRSAWIDLRVVASSPRTAIVTTRAQRMAADDRVLEEPAATYALAKRNDEWLIVGIFLDWVLPTDPERGADEV
jgi:ketosteroid isomerase-like protein